MPIMSKWGGNLDARACVSAIKRNKELKLSQFEKLGYEKPTRHVLRGMYSRIREDFCIRHVKVKGLKTLAARSHKIRIGEMG